MLVSNIFYFHHHLGKLFNLTIYYFSIGLKPPTRLPSHGHLSTNNFLDFCDPSSRSDASTAPVESALGKFVDGSDQKVSAKEVSRLPEPFLFHVLFRLYIDN